MMRGGAWTTETTVVDGSRTGMVPLMHVSPPLGLRGRSAAAATAAAASARMNLHLPPGPAAGMCRAAGCGRRANAANPVVGFGAS